MSGIEMLKHLDLCSGIGGFAVGFSMAELSEPIAFCDTDASSISRSLPATRRT